MIQATLSQIFAAYIFIASLPVFTSIPAALITKKLHFFLLLFRQSIKLFKCFIQSKIRHYITELFPPYFIIKLFKLCKNFSC